MVSSTAAWRRWSETLTATPAVVTSTIAPDRARTVALGLRRGSRAEIRAAIGCGAGQPRTIELDARNRMWCLAARIRDFGPVSRADANASRGAPRPKLTTLSA